TNGSSKRKNRKTCFVCRSVDHLIKDCNFHKTLPTPRNYTHRVYNKQHASFAKNHPQKQIIPAAVLTKSKPESVTAVRPVSAAVPNIMISRPRHALLLNTRSNSTIRRHKTCSQSSKTSNSSPKVTAAKASVVSVVKGKKGKWVWRPKCSILDHDSRTTGSNSVLSLAKPAQDISHATRPMAPIIEDWVSDSEDDSEPNDPQSAPSFVQTSEHVKPFGHSVQPVEAPILDATPKPTSSNTNEKELDDVIAIREKLAGSDDGNDDG
nr:hypothetical protein [Tanacetum cinerariifolium]